MTATTTTTDHALSAAAWLVVHYLAGQCEYEGMPRRAGIQAGWHVLDVPITGEQPSEWTEIVALLLWANSGGGTHTFDEYRTWLEAAGFAQVWKLSERWLAAIKAE